MKPSYLKPLNEKESAKNEIAVFDIESHEWTHFVLAGIYDGKTYRTCKSVAELVDSLLTRHFRDKKIYAHYGGKFDFLFLVDEIQKREKLAYSLIKIGPKLACVKVWLRENPKYKWEFRDSSCFFQDKLERVAEIFAATKKRTGAINFKAGEKFNPENPEHLEYLKADCFSLYESLTNFFSNEIFKNGVSLTLASQAMKEFRRHHLKRPILMTSQETQDFVRRGYCGGRCEVYDLKPRALTVYDVNSLYPFVMKNFRVPLERIGAASDVSQFGFHDVTVTVPDLLIPPLPMKAEKLYFPTGTFRGVYFSDEIQMALKMGCKIEKYHRGEIFSESHDFFTSYVDKFWEMRQKYEKNHPLNYVAKLFLNCLYGKFPERELRTKIESFTNQDRFEMYDEKHLLVLIEEFKRSPHMLCHIGAAVTANARIHVYENYLAPYAEKIAYTDTDSLFSRETFKTGSDLGELKKEYSGIFAPRTLKMYQLITEDGKIIRKAKGFSQDFINSLTEEQFLNSDINERLERIFSFSKSIKQNKEILSKGFFPRAVRNSYDKRKVLKNGQTRPWKIENGSLK